ncbi:SIR2 family protein [Mucilaginibacter boryungensis]|uniref:SIR2 family protein n=1 Tax=Mucilaginibacter boryungensis TaxID=768480 RepID=A0ABR9XLD1_9SPHI|nr:SIR2 family protein [Mucilaginibacter boryungensis]MBE9668086.1 SIR2 family protein [Mucilaginibacter boryungensis]
MALPLSEFVKFFPLRAKRLAWLFGAGSSISAGVPSAYDLTWDFKKRIYCAEQSYPLSLFSNLTDPGIREQIQNYFDSQGDCPPFDSPEEYSYYFERAFSSPGDRSEYISKQTIGLQLNYGHKVMGILMKNSYLNLVFTTNFDKAFENIASAQFEKLEQWYAADLDSGDNGMRFFQSGKRPLIVKLHGDYFSNNIKNTTEELKKQDQKLRGILSIALDTNGLCVMGYSGRDRSVMEVLKEAIDKPDSFSCGLYWFVKAGSEPLPEVTELITNAKAKGKEAEIIEIDTFDTAWADIIKGFENIAVEDLAKLNQNYQRIRNQPIPGTGRKYPLIRLNAVPILNYPATARLFKCDAGNTKEVKDYIAKSNKPIFAIRKKTGIVGFGADADFVSVFTDYGHYEVDIFQITERDLMYDDSAMKGMITTALLQALTEGKPLRSSKRRQRYLLFPDPKKVDDPIFAPLKKIFTNISGKIPNTGLVWVTALEINIQYILSQPLLVLTPTILASKSSVRMETALVAPFVKEFMARWYNQKYDDILNCWLDLIFGVDKKIKISAFAETLSGINATFELSRQTAFTRTN